MKKILFKQIFTSVALCGVAFCVGIGCSNNDADAEGALAAKTQLTLSKYYNERGATSLPTWKYSDQATLYVADHPTAKVAYAAPILAGSQSSLFLFEVEASAQPTTVVSVYPSDAAISCAQGVITTTIATQQDGTIKPSLIGKTTARVNGYEGCEITLAPWYCTMYVHAKRGNYAIKKVQIVGNNGEKIAGDLRIDVADDTVTASAAEITVVPETPYNCAEESQLIPVMIAPVTLAGGYTITLTDTDNQSFEITTDESVELVAGDRFDTDDVQSSYVTELIFCGSNWVYMLDADLAATANSYKEAVTWSWDATRAATAIGLSASSCDHLDDCKPVDNNKKLLITSSYNWCVLLDIKTEEVLFYTTQCPNAHSAELLPNNRIAVACSNGSGTNNSKIQIYNISEPNRVLLQVDHSSAHGVVWNETTQRLYTIGGQTLKIFTLKNWDTASPSLELERSVATPQSGLHDLSYVNANTLCVAGRRVYLYDIGANSFTEKTQFAASTAMKSANYNDETGEMWYTDSTVPEGTQSWSTQTLYHTSNPNGSTADRAIKIPDLDVYKVRVMNW